MKPHKFQALLEYARTHLNKKRCRTILVALACVVVFGTTYALILPAVTMTPELICDKPEHEHTADCYEQELVCDNDDPDHEHDDSCYEEVLICGEEEHQHNEDCYAFPDEDEENTDGTDPEAPADADDADADDADAEEEPDEPDAPDWEADLPDRTGNWAEDVVAVAESQLDNEDLSRYGDWYTESTGADEDELDTTAPFVAFCLHYAGVSERDFPWEANTGDWFDRLADEGLLGEDIPEPGDLLFYEDEGIRMGIVTGVDVSDEDEYTYTIIESDLNGAVGESEHIHDFRILGYAPLPENPDENGGSAEEPDEPDQPSDSDKNDSKPDSDSKDQDQSDADGDKSDEDKTDHEGKDEENKDPEAPAEEPDADTLPDVPKGAISAADADKTLQVTVQMALCTEHDHLGSTLAKPRYQPGDEAQGTITVTTTDAEPAEGDTTVVRVYLAFENNTGTTELPGTYEAKSENGHKYTYLVKQIGDSNTYYFEIPRLHPGDTLTIPFAARYLVSTEHGGKASLWCTVTSAEEATQDKPEKVKTLTWESDAVELVPQGPTAGKYGNYTLEYNETKNAFTEDPKYSKYVVDSPLGVAGSFHLVAFDTVYIGTHCNGNILAYNADIGANFGTNNYPDELTYVVNYLRVQSTSGSSTGHTLVVGSNNRISVGGNRDVLNINDTKIDKPYNIIHDVNTEEMPFIDLNEVKADIQKRSNFWAKQPENGVIEQFKDLNNAKLLVPNPDGAYYYNMSIDRLESLRNYPLKLDGFQGGHNGTLIINVDCSGRSEINLPQSCRILIDGQEQSTNEVTTFENGKVIWNFINANGVTINTQLMTGAVIAPGATVNAYQNLNGTIVADTIYIRAETHRTDFTGTVVPTNLSFQAQKTVDGKTPTLDQLFTFKMEEWDSTSSTWKDKYTATNYEGAVNFPEVEYTEADAGTYWYCIYEQSEDNTGYRYDTTKYFVEVKVALDGKTMKATYTYYQATTKDTTLKGPDGTTLEKLSGQSKMVFANTTDNGAHTLPSTGGIGEWSIPSIGILFMAGSLLVISKQRPQRKEDR